MAHRLRIGILYVLSAAMLTVLIGCAGIDPDAAKSLGTAGQGAAQAIYDQANARSLNRYSQTCRLLIKSAA